MLPAIFPWMRDSSSVTDLIGTDPVRCYRHGSAPQAVEAPYLTWYVVLGLPENDLSDTPPVDSFDVDINCWSDDPAQVETLGTAVRDAAERHADMTGIDGPRRDPETMRYRLTLTFKVWRHR